MYRGRGAEGADHSSGTPSPHTGPPTVEHGGREWRNSNFGAFRGPVARATWAWRPSQCQPWMSIMLAHTQLVRLRCSGGSVKYLRQKKWHIELVSQQSRTCIPTGSFRVFLWFTCLACFALCHASFMFPCRGEGIVTLGMFPQGYEDTVMHKRLLFKGGWGGSIPQWVTTEVSTLVKSSFQGTK